MSAKLKKLAHIAGPIASAALLLFVLSFVVDFRDALRQLAEINLTYFGGAVLLMIVNIAVATLRYRGILSALGPQIDVPFAPLMQLNFLTLFCAHFLPFGALADAMRAIISRSILKISTSNAIEAVIVDRGLAACGFALTGLLFLPIQIEASWPIAIIALQAIGFGGILTFMPLARFSSRFFPKSFGALTNAVQRFFGHAATVRNALWQLSLAVASVAAFAGMLFLLASGLNLKLSIWIALSTASAIYISQIIPIFYAGFGSREVAVAALLVPAGVLANTDAVALALSLGACNLIASLPGAIFAGRLYSTLYREKGR